jgi:hypothetical protein
LRDREINSRPVLIERKERKEDKKSQIERTGKDRRGRI